MFDRILWGLGIAIVISICITSIRPMTSWNPAAPDLGDVFTFGSILVASIIAYVGWKRADKNQRDIWNRADEKQKEASSKNAAVQAIILYAGFAETIDIAFEILDTIKFTPKSLITREDQQDYIRNEIGILLPNIERNFDFSSAMPLLQDDIFMGERYIVILQYLRSLESVINLFVRTNFLNEAAQSDKQNKVITDELHIARLTLQAGVVLGSIDILRGALSRTTTAQDSNISSLNIKRYALDSAFRHVDADPEPELTDAENYTKAVDRICKTASQAIDDAEKKFDEILASEIE
ncbi:MAG: hypothetical protein COB25_018550 [Oceanospirillales bacterium]|nr:hypothetical protein [Oceanospirillales bacterium]